MTRSRKKKKRERRTGPADTRLVVTFAKEYEENITGGRGEDYCTFCETFLDNHCILFLLKMYHKYDNISKKSDVEFFSKKEG